jgi:holo-[acyl-carrier protein] synthase
VVVGVGIDAVEIARFRAVLERRPRMADRLFTSGERRDAATRVDGAPSLAARFAAKEAVMKALGVGLGAFGFHDAEVVRTGTGAPTLRLTGAAEELARAAGVVRWHLSLTHTDASAMAVAVAE